MSRRQPSIALAVALVTLCAAGSVHAVGLGTSRAKAERNVLRALDRGWGKRRIRALFNPRTHLLRDNTQAVCKRARGRRTRFLCIVRPARHRPRQGLYIVYRALSRGRFKLRWLFYRRG